MLTYKQTVTLLETYTMLKHTIEQLTEDDKILIIAQLEAMREAFPDIKFNWQ